jgi:aminomethyltransferase
MGEVWVTGPDAAAFLDYALAGKLSAVAVGKAKYSLICHEDGGIIDDLISYRRPERTEVPGGPNAGNAKVVAAALAERAAGFDVVVEDVSAETSLIAVQGPNAEAILLTLVPAEQHALVTELKYYAAVEVEINGQDLLLARTGYTGEDGFEIYIPNEDAAGLWEALLEAVRKVTGSSPPASPAATRSASKPACRSTATSSPARATPTPQGLGPVVSLAKEGATSWARPHWPPQGRRRRFHHRPQARGPQGPGPPRRTRPLPGPQGRQRRRRGHLRPAKPHPRLPDRPGLCRRRAFAEPGTILDIDLRGKAEPFEVVALPFYKRQK